MRTIVDWTEDRVFQLTSLWMLGFTTADIGRRIGVSKNAVIGKKKRLGLPDRESPIAGGTNKGRKLVPRAQQAAEKRHATSYFPTRTAQCCWPFGDPKRPGFHFCEEKQAPGKPYCPAHCSISYSRSSRPDFD